MLILYMVWGGEGSGEAGRQTISLRNITQKKLFPHQVCRIGLINAANKHKGLVNIV